MSDLIWYKFNKMTSSFYTLLLSSATEAIESEPLPLKTPSMAVTVQVREPNSTSSNASDCWLVSTFLRLSQGPCYPLARQVIASWSRPKKHRINIHPKNRNCLPVLFTRHHLLGSVLLPGLAPACEGMYILQGASEIYKIEDKLTLDQAYLFRDHILLVDQSQRPSAHLAMS